MAEPERARVLEAAADALQGATDELVAAADSETALGETRLRGEMARTTGQLRMFADLIAGGEHLDAIISEGDPSAGRPDVRRISIPVGPVAVFSASNFPFAFSVAGGDTASALAAGCPVVVKAHEGHPLTSRLTTEVLLEALAAAGAPTGVLATIYGFDAGRQLVAGADDQGCRLHRLAARREGADGDRPISPRSDSLLRRAGQHQPSGRPARCRRHEGGGDSQRLRRLADAWRRPVLHQPRSAVRTEERPAPARNRRRG